MGARPAGVNSGVPRVNPCWTHGGGWPLVENLLGPTFFSMTPRGFGGCYQSQACRGANHRSGQVRSPTFCLLANSPPAEHPRLTQATAGPGDSEFFLIFYFAGDRSVPDFRPLLRASPSASSRNTTNRKKERKKPAHALRGLLRVHPRTCGLANGTAPEGYSPLRDKPTYLPSRRRIAGP